MNFFSWKIVNWIICLRFNEIVKFCEHSKEISSSSTLSNDMKCHKLCDLNKALHHHGILCSSTPERTNFHPNFQPINNIVLFRENLPKPPPPRKLIQEDKKKQHDMSKERHRYCAHLCRMGNGGKLCKCDLSPF